MRTSFENNNDVIVYALAKIISFARENQYIFLAQSIWWISSIAGLQPGLITYIDNLESCSNKNKIRRGVTVTSRNVMQEPEEDCQNTILKKCEEFLWDPRWLWDIVNLKSTGRTKNDHTNPRTSTKKALKERSKGNDHSKTEGIEPDEVLRRKVAGECLCCAWPPNRKGAHTVKDCIRPIKLEKGTASYLKVKSYHQ